MSTANVTQSPNSPSGFGFAWRFAGIFLLLQLVIVFQFGDVTQPFMIERATVQPSVVLLDTLFPAEKPFADGDTVRSKAVSLKVLRGCEGTEFYLLLAAAILAFAASWRQKLLALAAGIAIVFALNQLRLLGLYIIVRDFREYFQLVHVYFAPLLLVAALVIVFSLWATRVLSPPRAA
ncbi:MAG: exosortase/archaeosortase family protein [Pseudomonadota bacterium]